MLIYFCVFAIALFFAIMAKQCEKRNRKKLSIFFSLISIIIPSLLAGFRASGVGTDTKVYIDWIFKETLSCNNINEVFNVINRTGVEPLYCIVNYIVSRFSNSLTVIYFTLELIILGLAYIGIYKTSKYVKLSYPLAYCLFLLIFFNKTLNMCRQSMAMAVCLFAIPYIINRDIRKYFLCMIIGFLFHRSIIIFLPVYYIYNIATNDTRKNAFIRIVLLFVLLICVIFFKQIVIILVNIGALSSKYLNYVYHFGSKNNIKPIEIISEALILFICLLTKKNLIKNNVSNKFLVYLIELGFVAFLYGYNAAYSQRISYYFSIVIVLILPQIIGTIKDNKDKIMTLVLLMSSVCIYSYIYYGKYQFDQTTPYQYDNSYSKRITTR